MESLFEGKVLVVSNADMVPGQKNPNVLYNLKHSLKPVRKAQYVLYFNEDTNEMTVIKHRKGLK